MTDTPPPPPPQRLSSSPPAPEPATAGAAATRGAKKKGLPPLAWVGIGCGCLLLLIVIGVFVATGFLVKKAGDVASDFAENPMLTAAEVVVRTNPDLELVETDREKKRIEVRNKRTGETFFIDAEDLEEGKVTFGSDGEEQTLRFGTEEGQGYLEVEGPEGTQSYRAGKGAAEVPDWVPVPAGAEVSEGGFSMTSAGTSTGQVTLKFEGGLDEVLDTYQQALEDAGFEVTRSTYSAAGQEGASLQAESEDGLRTLMVGLTTTQEGGTAAALYYSETSE